LRSTGGIAASRIRSSSSRMVLRYSATISIGPQAAPHRSVFSAAARSASSTSRSRSMISCMPGRSNLDHDFLTASQPGARGTWAIDAAASAFSRSFQRVGDGPQALLDGRRRRLRCRRAYPVLSLASSSAISAGMRCGRSKPPGELDEDPGRALEREPAAARRGHAGTALETRSTRQVEQEAERPVQCVAARNRRARGGPGRAESAGGACDAIAHHRSCLMRCSMRASAPRRAPRCRAPGLRPCRNPPLRASRTRSRLSSWRYSLKFSRTVRPPAASSRELRRQGTASRGRSPTAATAPPRGPAGQREQLAYRAAISASRRREPRPGCSSGPRRPPASSRMSFNSANGEPDMSASARGRPLPSAMRSAHTAARIRASPSACTSARCRFKRARGLCFLRGADAAVQDDSTPQSRRVWPAC